MLRLDADAVRAIRTFLKENSLARPIRIELASSGCCDPTFALRVDRLREDDLVAERDDLVFVVSEVINRLVGEVTIS